MPNSVRERGRHTHTHTNVLVAKMALMSLHGHVYDDDLGGLHQLQVVGAAIVELR